MAFGFTLVLAVAATQPSCGYDAEALLALPFGQFDQDLTGGWRGLDNAGCRAAAAELLRRYRNEHQPLTNGQRSLLLWHEGQVSALSGDYRRAIPLLLAGVPIEDQGDFTEYALGTVAFLRGDKAGLLTARARLAALPRPADWTDGQTVEINGKSMTITVSWPPNLNVLDGLIMCFGRPYSVAYSCQPLRLKATTPPAAPSGLRR